jgi:hypothetical protein
MWLDFPRESREFDQYFVPCIPSFSHELGQQLGTKTHPQYPAGSVHLAIFIHPEHRVPIEPASLRCGREDSLPRDDERDSSRVPNSGGGSGVLLAFPPSHRHSDERALNAVAYLASPVIRATIAERCERKHHIVAHTDWVTDQNRSRTRQRAKVWVAWVD